jgi:formylglycine-generating enzyme required for sulfatase activity
MADLAGRKSCSDTAGARTDVPTLLPIAPIDRTGPQPGGWNGEKQIACTLQPRAGGLDPEACIPGGAFVLGDTLALGDLASHPQRVRVVEPFLLDVHELTVARYRAAIAAGFVAPDASPVPNPSKDGACTWSVGASPAVPAPGVDRETLPLTCVTWYTARAVCKFLGGDLPTEDQWEYAATAAGRVQETAYPWGDAFPDCARAAIGRVRTGIVSLDTCAADTTTPVVAVDALPWSAGDVTPQGIAGLAGNVHEWLVNGLVPYDHPAWASAGLRRPFAIEKEAPMRAARGSDWAGLVATATGSTRRAEPPISTYDNVGFRCARSAR